MKHSLPAPVAGNTQFLSWGEQAHADHQQSVLDRFLSGQAEGKRALGALMYPFSTGKKKRN